jgi:nucleoside-diphosphate-sugar epimerase
VTIQRVAVVGATGFTGEHVMRRLAAAGIQATAVVRATSDRRTVRELTDRFAVADMECAEQMEAALRGHDAMIHVASMGFRDAPAYVDAVERAGVQRAVFTSTTSILTRLPVRSKPIRAAAEHAVQGSAIDWTIIRPTMIYGTDRDRNICRLLKFLKRWRCMVLPGGGRALQQPVHVDDVADAAVSALFETRASRRTYNLSGEHSLTFRALVETAARSIGVRPWTLHAPVDGLATAVGVLERARFPLRLRAEQILRIAEDKAFDHEDASRDFGFRPRSFEEGVGQEAQLLGLASKARA